MPIAFCHIDMNCSPPEIAALSCFWDRLVPGAMVLLDDYAYCGYQPFKDGVNRFAEEKGLIIASLPTGQALLSKDPEFRAHMSSYPLPSPPSRH